MKREYENWDILHKKMTPEGIEVSFKEKLEYALSKDQYTATLNDDYLAMAIAVRDRIVERWITTQQRYHKENLKRVYYLSMEFLIGRLLGNYIFNLGIEKNVEKVLEKLGIDFEEIREQELDAGLGNGGLGRLAACFLDSMATIGIPAHGYGIRYDYGIFQQKIKDGYQIELADKWLSRESPWEFARPEYTVKVRYYGRTVMFNDTYGNLEVKWIDTDDVLALPYDFPIPGYKNDTVNTLRLWSARSTEDFDIEYFNKGDYENAVHKKILSENISKVLYPNDEISQGKELRLKQEYFFVAASIADIIRRFQSENSDLSKLPDKVVIQLNDTHPSLAIPELMRVLLDTYSFDWDLAWDVVRNIFAYTNHTVMSEALERWTIPLIEKLLPRHMQIIYEINARFLNDVAHRFPGDIDRLRRMSIIEEGYPKKVRMAHLSIVGSFSVNGVSNLHTNILRNKTFKDFFEFYPEKFNNKTNGVTQRRWLLKANTRLSDLIISKIGTGWITKLDELEKLMPFKEDSSFRKEWRDVKNSNKNEFAMYIKKTMNIAVNTNSIFDIQVKRMHEYKRQLLFGLYIISQYLTVKNNLSAFIYPRTFFVGGKAAPGYYMAKLLIKFLNNIAARINPDRSVNDKIKLIFLENYRVSLAEKVFPASDLSEQISTAGTEASGTGNMKFMLNGALTIGTLDGANIEIADAVGQENIFIFGNTITEINKFKVDGYNPKDFISRSPMLKEIIRLIRSDFFSQYAPGIFNPILESLENNAPYFICADFEPYCRMQDTVSMTYLAADDWTQKSIVNVSKAGRFSSDRTIMEYAKDIWKV
ncbi:MAG: glycogen/starch/alpha-glucan phosphorylase [Elusimicrobiota bacterium]